MESYLPERRLGGAIYLEAMERERESHMLQAGKTELNTRTVL